MNMYTIMQQALREQNYQLKNEITDLKNAFDLNRDILKILSTHNSRSDPQHHLLMQIITRLTTVNNQAMLNCLELIQQKNILKQENLRLNLELKTVEDKFADEVDRNRLSNSPTDSKMLIHEQFAHLNRELMAANEERIAKEQEIEFWKRKFSALQRGKHVEPRDMTESQLEESSKKEKIKRKYTSNELFKYESNARQLERENRTLKQYIEELENRLLIFIKAYNLEEDTRLHRSRGEERITDFDSQREEIRLLKYALNDISVQRKDNDFILTITQRFKEKDSMNNTYVREKRSFSWPKHTPGTFEEQEEGGQESPGRNRMEERERQY